MSFFPSDLEIANVQSPFEIITEAKREWDTKGKGIVTLLVDEGGSTSESDTAMTFIRIYALHIPTERVESLLTVVHSCGKPYPARIKPEKEDTPDYLRKEIIVPAKKARTITPGILQAISEAIPAHAVSREWVCESPEEFRRQLAKALTLGSVKSAITNIIAASTYDADPSSASALSVDEPDEDHLESSNDGA
jgi:hypothetical protein